jgi:hypothetical protein
MKIIFFASLLLMAGCAYIIKGPAELASGQLPDFLETGRTSISQTIAWLGEPQYYREIDNRAFVIYYYIENYVGTPPSSRSCRLYLVFEDGVLVKSRLQKISGNFRFQGFQVFFNNRQ